MKNKLKVKSITIRKTNNVDNTISKTINSEDVRTHINNLNDVDIEQIISKINNLKLKIYNKDKKETPPEYILRKLKKLVKRRDNILTSSVNMRDNTLLSIEYEIKEQYREYDIVKKKIAAKKKFNKYSTDRFGTESNNSILSIGTKRH